MNWGGSASDYDSRTVLANIMGSSRAELAHEDPHLGQKWPASSPCQALDRGLPWMSGLGLKAEAESEAPTDGACWLVALFAADERFLHNEVWGSHPELRTH